MSKKRARGLTRRQFAKLTAAGALAVGGPAFLFPDRARAAGKTLKIIQWSHFVPGYDKWFDGVYTKEWGAKNDTEVIVDHIAIGEINARAAAEAAAKKGHDLFMFLSPPAAYEKQVIDHGEIYQEVQKKHGKVIPLGEKSTYNPKTKKFFAFTDSYVPDPGNYRKDLWEQVG
ncbi:MAG TPA: carbohydrate ABC transporter substrate-binding protein, partial [Thermoanaerobaculia bacterium]